MTEREGKSRGEFDFGVGGMFKGIGKLFELVSEMTEEGTEELSRTGGIKGLPDKARGIYGFTIRMGLGGQPTAEQFGNIRKTEKGAVVAEVREPIVDIFDEEDFVLVLAELPGVDESDIHLEARDDILNLTAESKDRKYSKEVLLPSAVDADTLESTYKNGVLEIKLIKKKR